MFQIKRRLKSYGIDDHDFDAIDHSNCINPTDASVNLNIDDKTITNAFKTAVKGVSDLGVQVSSLDIRIS